MTDMTDIITTCDGKSYWNAQSCEKNERNEFMIRCQHEKFHVFGYHTKKSLL